MSYLDVYQTISVNCKLAKITNPTTALYFGALLEVYEQVKRKKTFDPASGVFRLDRTYVADRSGIPPDEQRNCDRAMAALGVIRVDPLSKDKLAIDMKRLVGLLADESKLPEEVLPKTIKMTKADRQASKEAGIKSMLASAYGDLKALNPKEREAVETLVDVYYSKGLVKRSQWELIFKLIKSAAHGPDAVSEMIDYVLATNYASIPAALDSFMKSKQRQAGSRIGAQQKKSSGEFLGQEF
jgi:hypothetical protein